LGSSRLTLLLLAALLLTALLASLFPQMPAGAENRMPWLEAVTLRHGRATPVLHTLGIFDAYHSPWYVALLAGLILNAAACTLQRLPRLWHSLTRPPHAVRPQAFYQGFAHQYEWPMPHLEVGSAEIQYALRQRRYRLYVDPGDACTHIYAERGRWAQAGTLLTHLSAIILVFAVTARPALGWQSTGVTLLPGEAHTVDLSPPLTVRAGDLQIKRHPGGQPSDYQVPLAVLEGSSAITETVRINHPLTHRGVAFHLQGYGPAVRVRAPEGSFDLAISGGQAAEVVLPQAGLTLRLAPQTERGTIFIETLDAQGAVLASGTVVAGQPVLVGMTPVRFDLGRFTVWQVSHDPTFGLALAAACLMLAGTVISLWVPWRRLWLRLDAQAARMVGSGDAVALEALARELIASSDKAAVASEAKHD
jgi:cytochrome c biogenesis protein